MPNVSDALEAYERARRARVEAIVKHGRRSSQTKENGLVGRIMRDLVLRMVFKFQARRGADPLRWMWDYHIDWDAPRAAELERADGLAARVTGAGVRP